jgi:hypothetical protein
LELGACTKWTTDHFVLAHLSTATSCNINPLFLPISPARPTYARGDSGHALTPVSNDVEEPMSPLKPADTQDPKIDSLLGELGVLIRQARQKVLRAVDTIQVQTCWEIGQAYCRI